MFKFILRFVLFYYAVYSTTGNSQYLLTYFLVVGDVSRCPPDVALASVARWQRTGYCLDWQYVLTVFAMVAICQYVLPLVTNANWSLSAQLRRYGRVFGHIFSVDSRVPLFNAFVWSKKHKCRHESFTVILKSLSYIFVAGSMGQTSTSMTWLALKPTAFGGKHHEMAMLLFKVIQGHQFLYRSKAYMRLPFSESYKRTSHFAKFL